MAESLAAGSRNGFLTAALAGLFAYAILYPLLQSIGKIFGLAL
jgi:hypothetical protein